MFVKNYCPSGTTDRIFFSGLGFLAIGFYSQFNLASMYAVIVLIFVLAGVANWIMGILLARFSRYRGTLET